MFDIFQMTQEFEQERESDRFNDNLLKIQDFNKFEQQDAEELINEVDLDFECHFDQNLLNGRRKSSSGLAGYVAGGGGNIGGNNSSGGGVG
jgi:hypothetical protein